MTGIVIWIFGVIRVNGPRHNFNPAQAQIVGTEDGNKIALPPRAFGRVFKGLVLGATHRNPSDVTLGVRVERFR